MPNKSFSRAVRHNHIMMVFINRFKKNLVHQLTASQVARALGLEPSAHFRGLMADLVVGGRLKCWQSTDKQSANLKNNTGVKYWFDLSDSEVKIIEDEAREIAVKSNGKKVDQLRMF